MSIKETLPDWRYQPAGPNYSYPLHSAVRELAWAMQHGQSGKDDLAFKAVQQALALVRSHRKGLPDQGRRKDDYPDGYDGTALLHIASQCLLTSICTPGPAKPFGARDAEAALRTWLKRRLAEKEERCGAMVGDAGGMYLAPGGDDQ